MRALGFKLTPVDSRYVPGVNAKLQGGLYVQAVRNDSPGALATIRKGDILVGLIIGERDRERELATVRPDNVVFILRQPEVIQSSLLYFLIIRDHSVQKGAMRMADIARAEGTIAR